MMNRKASIATLAMLLVAASPAIAVNGTSSLYVNLELSMNRTTVGEVIQSISRQTGYEFSYDESLLNKQIDKVSVNVKNVRIENVLSKVFRDTGISFKIVDNRIFLKDETVRTISYVKLDNQQQRGKSITGVVVDNSGTPIIGANVVVKGKNGVGTITDIDGKFTLTDIADGTTLLISYIGYTEQAVAVSKDAKSLKVTLHEDTQKLDEVVVVGYGTQKKVNMTGSISNVKADELTSIATPNLSNTLAGRAPGLTITGNSGLLGSSSEIRMRGGFGDPLFVIDGIIRDKDAFDALEANEVDQMSFLKDAATASVYGSAAGNGVVLVTTKSGSTNSRPVFNYQGSYSFSKTTKELFSDMFTATDELIYQNKVAAFKGLALPNGDAEFDYFKDKNYNVNDWIWQTPWNTKHSLSVTGGSEKVQYFVLGSYLGEEGSYKNLKNQKYSLRSNITMELSKYVKMNVNIDANQSDRKRFYWPFTESDDDQAIYDLYRCTFNALKTVPFYENLDGTPATHRTEYPIYPAIGSWQSWNVVDQVIGDRYIKTRNRDMTGILSFNVDLGWLLKGLSTKVVGNYVGKDFTKKKFMTYQRNYKFQQADPNGNRFLPGPLDLNAYNTFTFSQDYENLSYDVKNLWSEQFNWFINYNNKFGKHEIGAMGVFEQAKNGGEWVYARGENPLTNYDQMFVYSTDAERRYGDAEEYTGGRLSWIGRVNYNYDSRYMAEFSFRYDGNDKFAPGHRWGFFPSVSGAWRISQEPFMESMSSWLNNLKIRASYGTTGNDLNVKNKQILNFLYKKRYIATPKEDDDTKDYGTYVFGNSLANSIKPGDTPNPDLTWATSHTYNGGIDFGFLNNRLTGSVDAFYRKETNILGPRTLSIPSTYGQVLAPENYAARSWKGGEFEMNWRDKAVGGQLEYTVYMNLGFSRDKWLTLDEEAIYKTGNLADLSKVGMADSRLIGYKAVGLIRTQEEVDALKAKGFKQFGRDPYLGGILFEDTRGDGYSEGPDGKIDSNDYYNLLSTNATPRINYGFGGSVKYKGIYVDLHFQGVGKYDRVMGIDGFHQYGGSTRPYYPIWTSNDCWSPENPNGKYPRVVGSSWYESGTGPTSFWLRNGAYLRLKNVNVGYDLPKNILHVVGLSKAQIFMNATNLFYISAVGEFMDPEQKYYDSYPLMKTFTFGLNVTF